MPNKTCPSCKVETHVRTSNCKCGYSFYTPVKKTNEEVTVKPVQTPKVIITPSATKVVKDPAQTLTHEAETLGYTLKDAGLKVKELTKRFSVYKVIGHQRYEACFNKLGHITGVVQRI